jgi:hypothetical protein
MVTKLIVTLFCLGALLLVGCTTTETTNTNNTPAKAATPASSPAVTASTPAPSTSTASTSGDKIGVPECDEFLTKYEACVSDKVPEAQRATFKTSMAQMRTAWHNAASTPQGKAALGTTCKTALESARTSMSAYNCSF